MGNRGEWTFTSDETGACMQALVHRVVAQAQSAGAGARVVVVVRNGDGSGLVDELRRRLLPSKVAVECNAPAAAEGTSRRLYIEVRIVALERTCARLGLYNVRKVEAAPGGGGILATMTIQVDYDAVVGEPESSTRAAFEESVVSDLSNKLGKPKRLISVTSITLVTQKSLDLLLESPNGPWATRNRSNDSVLVEVWIDDENTDPEKLMSVSLLDYPTTTTATRASSAPPITVVLGQQTWATGNIDTSVYKSGQAVVETTNGFAKLTDTGTAAYKAIEGSGLMFNRHVRMSELMCPMKFRVASTADWEELRAHLETSKVSAVDAFVANTFALAGYVDGGGTGVKQGSEGVWWVDDGADSVFIVMKVAGSDGVAYKLGSDLPGSGGKLPVNGGYPARLIKIGTPRFRLTSGTKDQDVTLGDPITPIVFRTVDATSVTVGGLSTYEVSRGIVTIRAPAVAGAFNYTVTASNGDAAVDVSDGGRITVWDAPAIVRPADANVDAGASAEIKVAATNSTSVVASGLDLGVWTIVPAADKVTISGTPAVAGTHTYTVTATNGGTKAATFAGTITAWDAPAIVPRAENVDVDAGTSAEIKVAATNATSVGASGLDLGVWTIVPAADKVTISGTPVAGTHTYTVTATNGGTKAATFTGTITVWDAPAIVPPEDANANVDAGLSVIDGHPLSITVAATNATSVVASGLDLGVWTIVPAADSVTISGSPAVSGTHNYTVTATNGGTRSATFAGTITAWDAPAIVPRADNVDVDTGTYAEITVAATNSTWVVASGLDLGVWTIVPAADKVTISGTPVAGTHNYTVTATNGGTRDDTFAGTITVRANVGWSFETAGNTRSYQIVGQRLYVDNVYTKARYGWVGDRTYAFFTQNLWYAIYINPSNVMWMGSINPAGSFPADAEIQTAAATAAGQGQVAWDGTGPPAYNPVTLILATGSGNLVQTVPIGWPIAPIVFQTTNARAPIVQSRPNFSYTNFVSEWDDAAKTLTIRGTATSWGGYTYTVTAYHLLNDTSVTHTGELTIL
jgi:ribosomal protein L13